ncbi:hypothetical protein Bca4012_074119 [Brassica carinata]
MTISSKPQYLPLSLPVIDFSVPNLKPETPEWDSVRAQVRKALEDFGCFEALFDGASVELQINRNTGYSGQALGMPLYEGMGIDGVENPDVVNDLTHKVWPRGNITFSNTVHSFAEKLIELNVKVRTMVLESFGLEKHVEKHLNSAKNRFQLFKYKGLADNTDEYIGIDSHIDRHFLTILCQNDVVDGLEIKTKDGEDWIKAKPSQDSSFLVLVGASLHVLLNGMVHPPLHHVVITGKKDRYVPEEIVDDEHPRLYKPFNFEDYFTFAYKDTTKRDLSALKAYCTL